MIGRGRNSKNHRVAVFRESLQSLVASISHLQFVRAILETDDLKNFLPSFRGQTTRQHSAVQVNRVPFKPECRFTLPSC
jgi:hypothetical protein